MRWKFWIIVASMLLLVIFVAQNYESVEIKFLLWSFTTSKAIVLFLTLTVGIIIGWTMALLLNKKHEKLIKEKI